MYCSIDGERLAKSGRKSENTEPGRPILQKKRNQLSIRIK
jgi:hypothetical protein